MSKMNHTVRQSWLRESKMDTLILPPSLGILGSSSQKVMPNHIREWLMSLPLASPVSPSQSPESKKGSKTKETSGQKQGIPLASFDLDTSILKTSQTSLLMSTSGSYYPRLPKWGMIVGGELYPLRMWEPPISGKGGGLWPSPSSMPRGPHTGRESEGLSTISKKGVKWGMTLETAVKKWPTPRNRMTGAVIPCRSTDKFNNLESVMARRIWPTPREGSFEGYKTRAARKGHKIAVSYLETAVDYQEGQTGGQLNPDWVEWLMGWPIGWTDLKPLEMDKFQEWLRLHGRC